MGRPGVPEGYHSVTPYLVVHGAERLLVFLQQAFAATVRECMRDPEGVIRHAEAQIGDSVVMVSEVPEGKLPVSSCLYLYVAEVDAVYGRALAAGAASLSLPADQHYGDRNAGVEDCAGNQWWIATRIL